MKKLNTDDGGHGLPPNFSHDAKSVSEVLEKLKDKLSNLNIDYDEIAVIALGAADGPLDKNTRLKNIRHHATLFQRHLAEFVALYKNRAKEAANELTALYKLRKSLEAEIARTDRYIPAPDAEKPEMDVRKKLELLLKRAVGVICMIPSAWIFKTVLKRLMGRFPGYSVISWISGGVLATGFVHAYRKAGERIAKHFPHLSDTYWTAVEVLGVCGFIALVFSAASATGAFIQGHASFNAADMVSALNLKALVKMWALPVEAVAELGFSASMFNDAAQIVDNHRKGGKFVENAHWRELNDKLEALNRKISALEGAIGELDILKNILPNELKNFCERADSALVARFRDQQISNGKHRRNNHETY